MSNSIHSAFSCCSHRHASSSHDQFNYQQRLSVPMQFHPPFSILFKPRTLPMLTYSHKTVPGSEQPTAQTIIIQKQPSYPLHKECRICLESEEEGDNRLVAPCECSGSVRYVHRKCIENWLGRVYGKAEEEGRVEEDPQTYVKSMKCELCQAPFRVCIDLDWQWASKEQIIANFKEMFFWATMATMVFALSLAILILGAKRLDRDIERYDYDFFKMPFLNHELTILTGGLGVVWSLYFIVRHYFTTPEVKISIGDSEQQPNTHTFGLPFAAIEGELAKP